MGRKESPGHGNDKSRVSFRAEDDWIEAFEEFVENEGFSNRSDGIRAACNEFMEQNPDTETILPDDDTKRVGLEAIVRNCYPWDDGYIVNVQDAIGDICNATNLDERGARRRVLYPLEKQHYLTPTAYGKFEVLPEAVEEIRFIDAATEVAQA